MLLVTDHLDTLSVSLSVVFKTLSFPGTIKMIKIHSWFNCSIIWFASTRLDFLTKGFDGSTN